MVDMKMLNQHENAQVVVTISKFELSVYVNV